MNAKNHLYILWTSGDPITAKKMVFMYAINSRAQGWWEKLTLIIWGSSAKLVGADTEIQEYVQKALEAGIHVTACKACADQVGVSDLLDTLGVEVKYWGTPLTQVLKEGEKLITI
ncbi:MAG: hypothetical protein MAG431_01246 [Chloroflexi bacterium]|nr:hypothetical protein [Chloroflexota bacterium]